MKVDPEPEKLYIDACAVGFLNKRVPYIRYYTPHERYDFELFLKLDVACIKKDEYTPLDIVVISFDLLSGAYSDATNNVKSQIQEYILEYKPSLVIDGLEEVTYSDYVIYIPNVWQS